MYMDLTKVAKSSFGAHSNIQYVLILKPIKGYSFLKKKPSLSRLNRV